MCKYYAFNYKCHKRTVLIPVIHMAKATAKKMIAKHIKTVDSLGTKYTIKKDFYTQVLKFFRITAIIPNLEDRNAIHNTL